MALIAALVVVVARSAIFVFWEGSDFDADQAIFGLMAKHLSEGRAWPVFMYGQNYMLAVEAWLAAPLFLLAGPSVTALKLPLLAINCTVAVLLVRTLIRDTGVHPAAAAFASVFFVLPPPGTSAKLLEASGGNVEPFLCILLLWALRRRPAWCGLVLGVGCLNREFTIYGFVALAIVEMTHRPAFNRETLRRLLIVSGVGGLVWIAGQLAARFGSPEGPGTRWADLPAAAEHVEVVRRVCLDWRGVPGGYLDIVTIHWPLIFGSAPRPLRAFGIESGVTQGVAGAGALLGLAMILAAFRIARTLLRDRRWNSEYSFVAYLVLVGALSVSGYVFGRCGVISPATIRYDLLSLLGAAGLAAWYLRVEKSRSLTVGWVVMVAFWAGTGLWTHAQLWGEYLDHAPTGGKRRIVTELDARGIRYAISDYWDAYPIAFLSDERIVVSCSNRVRIVEYEQEVSAHFSDAVRIQRRPCQQGTEVLPGFYFCPAVPR